VGSCAEGPSPCFFALNDILRLLQTSIQQNYQGGPSMGESALVF
jgi:hypothetical protein